MAYEESVKSITLDADASIGVYTGVPGLPGSADPNSGKQYCFVKVTGKHTAGLATTAATDYVVGVLQNKPQKVGAAATVAIDGVTNVKVGGAFVAGDLLKVHTDGTAVKDATGANKVAVAIADGVTIGSIVPALLV